MSECGFGEWDTTTLKGSDQQRGYPAGLLDERMLIGEWNTTTPKGSDQQGWDILSARLLMSEC
jgi:hypothetical protein